MVVGRAASVTEPEICFVSKSLSLAASASASCCSSHDADLRSSTFLICVGVRACVRACVRVGRAYAHGCWCLTVLGPCLYYGIIQINRDRESHC